MSTRKILFAALLAVLAVLPVGVKAAHHGTGEKSRAHRTRSEKAPRHNSSKSKRQAKSASERNEFEQRWEQEQVEPDLPESP